MWSSTRSAFAAKQLAKELFGSVICNSSETWTVLCWTGVDVEFSDFHLAHTAVKHKPPRPEFAKTFQIKVCGLALLGFRRDEVEHRS